MKTKNLFASLLFSIASCAIAQSFAVSADGQDVTDTKTGLVWRRCAEGMNASGDTCTGTASRFTHETALMQASTQSISTGLAWRLPNIKELSSIADREGFGFNPAIDTAAFPSTPAASFWSSSPNVVNTSLAWYVNFRNGYVTRDNRNLRLYVRLVRSGA